MGWGENGLNVMGSVGYPGNESRGRVYSPDGCSPTLNGLGQGGNTEPKIMCIDDKGKTSKRPQMTYGYAPTLVSEAHGNVPKVAYACRMVGRNPENPTSREAGLPMEQMLETEKNEHSNTITTAQKDAMVLEYRF